MDRPGADGPPPRVRSPVDHAAARAGLVAVLVLVYAAIAALLELPQLRTATALALSIGLGGALVAGIQARRTLAVLWSELTAWIGFAFLCAMTWNALFGAADLAVAFDLAIGLVLLLLGFGVARAARRAAAA